MCGSFFCSFFRDTFFSFFLFCEKGEVESSSQVFLKKLNKQQKKDYHFQIYKGNKQKKKRLWMNIFLLFSGMNKKKDHLKKIKIEIMYLDGKVFLLLEKWN